MYTWPGTLWYRVSVWYFQSSHTNSGCSHTWGRCTCTERHKERLLNTDCCENNAFKLFFFFQFSVSYHSSPVRWCAVYLIRYATGSIFPSSITIFIRSVASPSENRPFFILSNNTSDSSMGRSLQGDGGALWPFSSSPFWWHTYAWPLNEDKESTQTSLTGFEQVYKRKPKKILDLPANKIHSELVELLEVVWCMRDSVRFVACVIQESRLETHLCECLLSSDKQQKSPTHQATPPCPW